MSNPIISPWAFYAISAMNVFKWVSLGIAIVMVVIVVYYLLEVGDLHEKNSDPKTVKASFKHKTFVGSLILFIIFTIFTIFIPDDKTSYTMIVAEFVTSDNLEIIYEETGKLGTDILDEMTDSAKEVIDYSVEKVLNIKGE